MVYRCFRKYFDTIVKPNNAQLTEKEKDAYHYKADCNSFLEECQKCCLCKFPLEAKVLNSVDKPNASCSRLDFVIRKEYQFLKNILSGEEIEMSRHLNFLSAYYDAMSFLLKAYEFFYRQAEYPVALDLETLDIEYKKFLFDHVSNCENKEHLHTKIKEFKLYRNENATPKEKAFAVMYSRFIYFPDHFHNEKKIASPCFLVICLTYFSILTK